MVCCPSSGTPSCSRELPGQCHLPVTDCCRVCMFRKLIQGLQKPVPLLVLMVSGFVIKPFAGAPFFHVTKTEESRVE